MKEFIKKYAKTLLFFAIVGIVGGFFVGLYMLDGYPEELKVELAAEMEGLGLGAIAPDIFIGIVTAVQSLGYGVILGGVGIFIAKRIGLWRDEIAITKKPLIISLVAAAVCGLFMLLPDLLIFGRYSEVIRESYSAKPSIPYVIATVTYGAVIEEVMLRLFAMSLVAFILCKLFSKGENTPTVAMLIAANVISSLLFGILHLPATFMLIGKTPLIIIRCIILNGALGLVFGYLYRKYGLRYAMIAHGGTHVVSKLIWLIFI